MEIFGPNPKTVSHQNIKDYLELRYNHFVKTLSWDLIYSQKSEYDEYDLPNALFTVVYQNNKCVGGARLMPTIASTPRKGKPPLTYMLRDFVTGNLEAGITENDMLEDLPEGSGTWEMTRFVSTSPEVTSFMLSHINDFLYGNGVDQVVTISPHLMPRVLRKLGYDVREISRPLTFDDKRYIALVTTVHPPKCSASTDTKNPKNCKSKLFTAQGV
ncbi:MAG: acyl-homoserine-lactone synthase [Pseudoruegeria sp.]